MEKNRKKIALSRMRTWLMAGLVFLGTNGWAPTIVGWWLSLEPEEQVTPVTPETDGTAARDDEPGNGCDDGDGNA